MSQLITCPAQDPAQQIADAILDRPVLLFSGQGSQEQGMGKDIAEASTDAMDLWKHAEKESGMPLREIYWDGTDADMNDTRALQPALTVVNLNLWHEYNKKHNPNPIASAGHSLGEYAALSASGILSPTDAIKITALRGRLMAECDPCKTGAMAAIVKLSDKDVESIVVEAANVTGQLLIAANYNTPQQTVISGHKDAVANAISLAKARKGRGIELKVSGAFHSPMMEEANKELKPLLEKVDWRDPAFPVYCNVDAKPVHSGGQAKKNMLRQMISPVFWVNLIRELYLAGARWWVEISPRAVLGKMVGPSLAGIAAQCDNLRVELVDSLTHIMQTAF